MNDVADPLQVSASFLQRALDSISAHIAILDGRGTILYVNEAWKRFARENALPDPFYAVGSNYLAICDCSAGESADEAPLVSAGIRRVIDDTSAEFRIEYPCHAPERERWFQMRVTRFPSEAGIHLVVVHENVTEIKWAERALREGESRLREITDTIGEGVCVLDLSGRISFVNPEAQRMLGADAQALLGSAFRSLLARHEGEVEAVAGAEIDTSSPWRGEERLLRRDGTLLPVLVSAKPIQKGGQPAGCVVALHDIRDLIAAREKDRLLIQQSRLAAMGEMIGNIAHQWRQPLNALGLVLSYIQDAHRLGRLSEELLTESIRDGRALIQRMSTTIDDFRNFFKPNKHKVRFAVNEGLADVARLLGAGLKNHGVELLIRPGEALVVEGVANEYSQVVLNVIGNARDAILERAASDRRIEVSAQREGDRCVVRIRDHAGGVAPEILHKVFEPYFTTKEKGTGIGLYMSKMIIEQNMRGSLRLANLGDGVEVVLETPLCPGESP